MDDEKVFELAEAFIKRYKKNAPYPIYKLSNVKTTKWWKTFQGVVYKFGDDKYWDAYKYVNYCFNELDKVLPFNLSNKLMYEEYKENIFLNKNLDKSILLSIKSTLDEIRNWSKKNNYESLNIEAFFNDKKNRVFLFRKRYSKYLLSILKFFENLTKEEKDIIMSYDELVVKRKVVLSNEKLKKKLQQILGEEFIG
jgi:hypothetical protein